MTRPDIDLDQPATAMWFYGHAPPGGGIAGSSVRRFNTLEGAVRFVVDDLAPAQRASARIDVAGTMIEIEEIETIFRRLPPPPSRATK